ncbi:MAG: UDP-4-amino-4,6-dideoxy-N-acetyl-beta-L-altrosamine transaminase [Candidatus Competibacteraceae bacterium]
MIPYGRQHITEADLAAVVEVLRSDFLTQGPMVPRFERAVADYCGATHAVAVNSATSALHLACLALGLGPGDWLWTSPNTFVASANCGLYCGAKVDFVDIDPRTYNLCPHKLAEKLDQAERAGRLPKVVVPVHFAGQPCDLAAIHALSQRYGFQILEDASHAIGASYAVDHDPGRSEPCSRTAARRPQPEHANGAQFPGEARSPIKTGSCRHSHITVFSFHPVKIITTGEGGMALTNDPELAGRMARLRSHGITREPALMTHEPDGPWYYQQIELGFNYRMTDIQAALGYSQLQRLEEFVARRHELAARYDAWLAGLPVIAPWRDPDARSAFHLYVIRLNEARAGRTRRAVFETLRQRGIGVNVHYLPVHTQPYYQAMGFAEGDYPEAERYYREAISLPLYPGLAEAEQDVVVERLRAILERR